MLRSICVLVLFALGAAAPAFAQYGRPLAGPGVPSYTPGVPSYNPGVPSQAPGRVLAPRYGQRFYRNPHRQNYAYPQIVYPYGYGYGATPVVIVPQTMIPPQRRRSTMDDTFFFDEPPF